MKILILTSPKLRVKNMKENKCLTISYQNLVQNRQPVLTRTTRQWENNPKRPRKPRDGAPVRLGSDTPLKKEGGGGRSSVFLPIINFLNNIHFFIFSSSKNIFLFDFFSLKNKSNIFQILKSKLTKKNTHAWKNFISGIIIQWWYHFSSILYS